MRHIWIANLLVQVMCMIFMLTKSNMWIELQIAFFISILINSIAIHQHGIFVGRDGR